MLRGEAGDDILERERKLQSLMNSDDPEVREKAKTEWNNFLEENKHRQAHVNKNKGWK